jgi:hypothetical protein
VWQTRCCELGLLPYEFFRIGTERTML